MAMAQESAAMRNLCCRDKKTATQKFKSGLYQAYHNTVAHLITKLAKGVVYIRVQQQKLLLWLAVPAATKRLRFFLFFPFKETLMPSL